MSTLSTPIILDDVTRIPRRGMPWVYRGALSIYDVFKAVQRGKIKYSPVYQRGFKRGEIDTMKPEEWNRLLELSNSRLDLDPKKAMAMAVKYLQGKLYTSHLTWNVRNERGAGEPEYTDHRLKLDDVDITVPDTAHRHLAYYYLGLWQSDPTQLPSVVEVDGVPVERKKIVELLKGFDPKKDAVFVEVFNLAPKLEGHLFDEFNTELRRVSTAVAIGLNPEKTPSRRFVGDLMLSSSIFAPTEIETRSNTIGSKSRKLTTNATLDAAVRPMTRRLAELEGKPAYDDLVKFVGAYFEEFAKLFPAYLPDADSKERGDLRDKTLAVSNVMFFPMFKLAFDLWEDMHTAGKDWNKATEWKTALRRLGGTVKIEDARDRKRLGRDEIEVMSRENPRWIGTLLVPKYDSNGKLVGNVLTNNYQTREAAYNYLCKVAGVRPTGYVAPGRKSASKKDKKRK